MTHHPTISILHHIMPLPSPSFPSPPKKKEKGLKSVILCFLSLFSLSTCTFSVLKCTLPACSRQWLFPWRQYGISGSNQCCTCAHNDNAFEGHVYPLTSPMECNRTRTEGITFSPPLSPAIPSPCPVTLWKLHRTDGETVEDLLNLYWRRHGQVELFSQVFAWPAVVQDQLISLLQTCSIHYTMGTRGGGGNIFPPLFNPPTKEGHKRPNPSTEPWPHKSPAGSALLSTHTYCQRNYLGLCQVWSCERFFNFFF